ncbi:MAG: hypothetical protein F6K18_00880 [Okeania sp. SIO2C2]|uniref:pentapeptide repeat-containing protein n=1 Tax=Okeania sp. SIO2C2 TaxID=2607787 RepID=UPI0013B85ED3|nr:pentapeptide repeat-containing protein [Okeania sp. SIO2C2]NEP85493.1 hypothetical protein [Okeania sp. SIO2C2]
MWNGHLARSRSPVPYTSSEVGYVGGNAATLLVRTDKFGLEGCNLSRSIILGADFTGASFQDVNFAEANLADCVFMESMNIVRSFAFSPDGKILASSAGDKKVNFWNIQNIDNVKLQNTLGGWGNWN